MGRFLRKSIRLGPLRLNLSKRGLGGSVGVKGLRAGVDASGKAYVAGGGGGSIPRADTKQGYRTGAAGAPSAGPLRCGAPAARGAMKRAYVGVALGPPPIRSSG